MEFDFHRFSRIAALAYRAGNPYTLEQCLEVFRCYFQTYEDYMGRPHPPIRRVQIARINHFFSGRIRELRVYEAEKGYE